MPKGKTAIEEMSLDSRIWIYQSDRKLNMSETALVRNEVSIFLENWKAHGNELMAGCTVSKQHFLIVALDESFEAASGCSIDSCVKKIQDVGNQIKVNFFERTNVAIMDSDNEVQLVPQDKIKELIDSGKIARDSIVFNNTIQKLSDLKSSWALPATESWIKRHFN